MKEFKECKVSLGEKIDSYYEDVLFLPISPSLLEDLARIFEERAMDTESYSSQGLAREAKDYFQDALDYWRKRRDELDKIY